MSRCGKGGLRQGGKTVVAFIKPARLRLLIGCILGMGLALLFLWSPAHVWAQEPGDRPVSLDVILLIDNSRSMSHEDAVTGAPPSDPEGLRIWAAKFLVDYLRANAETLGANYRVGMVSFGGVVSDTVSLRLLHDDTVREGIHAEVIQFTDFHGPLQFALGEFRAKSIGTGNKMAVILLTDGRPHLADAPVTEQELRAYFEDLAPLVGELQAREANLFVLGIGDAQEDRDNWTRLIPEEHYTPITSTTELADVYHRIVADFVGVAVSEGETIPAGQEVPIEVEPYLERIVFSFVKTDPASRIILTSPTGAVLTPTIGGTADVHHSIYRITNPDAGEWKTSWEGEGEVRYWVAKQCPLIQMEAIESPSLVGQPITITASLMRNNVTVVDPGLHLEAEITLPGGDVVTQVLSHVGGGRYTGGYEDVRGEGTYTVTARAFLDGQPLSVRLLPATVRVFPLPAVAMPTPSPTTSPSATPGVVAQVTTTATPLVPAATPQPGGWPRIVGPVLSVMERYWWLVFVIPIGGASLVVLVRWLATSSERRRLYDRIRGAKDDATASTEFQKAWENIVREAESFLEGREEEFMEALRSRFQYAEGRDQPIEKFYEDIGPHLGDVTEIERSAAARFLVDMFAQMKEIDILRDFLLLVQAQSRTAEGRAQQVSQTLRIAQGIADKRRNEVQLDDEKRRLSFIAEICGIYSELWLPRGKYLANPRKPVEEMLALLAMREFTDVELVRNLKTLYGLFQKTLGDFRLAEDSVPLRLEIVGDESAREKAIEDRLGEYPAKRGVASVLKYIANQPVFPLVPFLEAVGNAQKELDEQAERMEKARKGAEDEEGRILFVPDESILYVLLYRFENAVSAELEVRRSALQATVVNQQAYIQPGQRDIVLHVVVNNEPRDRARVGDAWNVRLAASPPLESKTLAPAAGYVPHILPWETNVAVDLVVTFRHELDKGERPIDLVMTFDDPAQPGQEKKFETSIEVLLAPAELEGQAPVYDELAKDELDRATGDDVALRRLLEDALKDQAQHGVVYMDDVRQAMDRVARGMEIHELVWTRLSADERKVLFALAELLASQDLVHAKSTDICASLIEHYPTELPRWGLTLKSLTDNKLVACENGLYRFNKKLVQAWIAAHRERISRDISWEEA